jgi:hypothetical protein
MRSLSVGKFFRWTVGLMWMVALSDLSSQETKEKSVPASAKETSGDATVVTKPEVTKIVGEFKVISELGLPPGFVVGKTVEWAGAGPAALPSPGSGRIKQISGTWALIEIIKPGPGPLGTSWVCVPTAPLRWQIAD